MSVPIQNLSDPPSNSVSGVVKCRSTGLGVTSRQIMVGQARTCCPRRPRQCSGTAPSGCLRAASGLYQAMHYIWISVQPCCSLPGLTVLHVPRASACQLVMTSEAQQWTL